MTELPEPPTPPQRRSRQARRRSLDREDVVEAAVRVLDAEGLDAVTVRRVALELGVGAASLYAYVDSKDALLDLVVDHVIGETDLTGYPDDRPWQEQTRSLITAMRDALAAHGDVARWTLGRIPSGPNALRVMDTGLGILRRSGLSDQVVAYAADLIGLMVGASAYEQGLHLQSGAGFDELIRYVEDFRRYLQALPPERFPNMVELAEPLTHVSPDKDERFEFMLDVLIAGLAAQR
jgi:AcrR family transcriptional regulator